jgi:phosphate transport system substrate-binding protein
MNITSKGVSSTTAGLVVVLLVVVVGAGAYVYVNPLGGNPTTVTVSVPTTSTAISTFTTATTSTATSTATTTSSATITTTRTTYAGAPSKVSLTAGGSSFVNPIMQVWVSEYYNLTQTNPGPVQINYQSVGSSLGQTGVLQGTFAFAGSDAPLPASALASYSAKGPLLQIPEALGGVAIFYNIPGVTTSLDLTGPVLAGIYNGSITSWNDARISALNPGVTLPSSTIVPVHRSDGSGTTYALTSYLATQSSNWRSTIGVGTAVNWPSFELASKGSSGVAGTVSTTPNSVGYADSYYAAKNNLLSAKIRNAAGTFVAPTVAAFSAAAASFSSALSANATSPIVNPPATAASAYPISTFTYVLVWANQTDQPTGWALATFLFWVVTVGQSYSTGLYYSPLPPKIVTIDQHLISQINFNGQAFTFG